MKFISVIYQENKQRLSEIDHELNNEEGQAIIEYLLLTLLMVAAFSVLNMSLKQTLGKYWLNLANRIVSACPKCPNEPLKIEGIGD